MKILLNISGQEEVIEVLDGIEKRAGDLEEPLADFGERMVRRIAKRLSGQVLKERSARLKNSLTHQENNETLEISAGGGPGEVDYANIHQYGGVIKPKRAKALTIPFPGGPADRRVPLRASDFEDTFIAKGIIFQDLGKENIVPLFILKKSVTIEASPYMYLEDSDVEYLTRSISDFIMGQ